MYCLLLHRDIQVVVQNHRYEYVCHHCSYAYFGLPSESSSSESLFFVFCYISFLGWLTIIFSSCWVTTTWLILCLWVSPLDFYSWTILLGLSTDHHGHDYLSWFLSCIISFPFWYSIQHLHLIFIQEQPNSAHDLLCLNLPMILNLHNFLFQGKVEDWLTYWFFSCSQFEFLLSFFESFISFYLLSQV